MTAIGCDINEKYLAEIIVSKLPDSMNTAVQILHEKFRLSIRTVLDNLDNHISDQAMKKKMGDAIALSTRSISSTIVYCKDRRSSMCTLF
ncbi:hypothetical protein CROQUDRAFT_661047 [Cronartium quercuum f. sp. fusiforme G11]|uniref:Uncharacterized protein n=1 Tax=Cronartium quercuum f. sp. fusiforme G11 TaxID=708437 RepID=A0A9P6TAH6_9BASI|nr:hypothetical protein CROQUDRAFT_661047 [Cronartium quercuum f. sp. fusiforme G11]